MAKISLCMIVGNVETYIARCLQSFLPIADEVCMVRAIGSQKADETINIARTVCTAAGKPFITKDYYNKAGHSDWPHVDDFAAARQMSFDLSTGDYCFWCDSDDVLESGSEHVRELADRGGYPCFVFPYKILGQGLSVPRDRMVQKSAGKWVYAVHEAFQFHISPVPAVQDDRVVITHLPNPGAAKTTSSNQRNLRILKSLPESDMHTGMFYHLHLENALAGNIPESVEAAKKALARGDIGKPEKYEIFLNLQQVTEDPAMKEAFLLQAYAADPCRREALGMLAVNCLNQGRNADGLSYARQMMATTKPKEAWNDRAAAYGWVGDDIYAQALRANGKLQDAEIVRLNALKRAGGPRIALIHATRGRYEQAAMTRKLWLDMADKPEQIEHIFVMDADDEESAPLRRLHHLVVPPGGGCVAAWNMGAQSTFAPVLVQLSDDWVPFPKWDEAILERLDTDKPQVLAISDGHRTDQLLCMVICTRRYLAIDHFMFHPWFTGVYSDNWFTYQAYQRGCVVEAKDIVFTHNHPAFGAAQMDKTYSEQNAPERYEQGAKVMAELQAGNDWSTVPGFFNYWSFYQFIARRLKDGDTVCEVGCWLGRSVIYLAQECQRLGKKVKIIAVDTFRGEDGQVAHQQVVKANGGNFRAAFEANLKRCGVADMVQIVEGDSAESAAAVADGSLAFCYIDAAHDYESVKRDITAWRGKVGPGGVLAGHDADHEPVARAVGELVEKAFIKGSVWVKEVK